MVFSRLTTNNASDKKEKKTRKEDENYELQMLE